MTVPVSRRVQRVKPSPTLAVTARAARLKAEGKDIIGLGAGEPDFDTPVHIADAGVNAIRSGFTRYTNVEGINELKDAIIAKFKRDNGLDYARDQVLVSSGAKQTIYNLCAAILDPDDEAIIPAPVLGFVSRHGAARRRQAGEPYLRARTRDTRSRRRSSRRPSRRARACSCSTARVIRPAPRTRARSWRRSGRCLLEHPRIVIGTDDMYEHIYWASEPFASLVTVVPQLYDRTITINGCSKAYAMTGWRIGYCGGPKEVITAMSTIQGQSTSNAASMSQKAAAAALSADQRCVAEMNKQFKARHDFIVAGLNSLPGVSCLPGAGTFYAFANVEKAMAAIGAKDDNAFAEYLLNQAGVAVVPGPASAHPATSGSLSPAACRRWKTPSDACGGALPRRKLERREAKRG